MQPEQELAFLLAEEARLNTNAITATANELNAAYVVLTKDTRIDTVRWMIREAQLEKVPLKDVFLAVYMCDKVMLGQAFTDAISRRRMSHACLTLASTYMSSTHNEPVSDQETKLCYKVWKALKFQIAMASPLDFLLCQCRLKMQIMLQMGSSSVLYLTKPSYVARYLLMCLLHFSQHVDFPASVQGEAAILLACRMLGFSLPPSESPLVNKCIRCMNDANLCLSSTLDPWADTFLDTCTRQDLAPLDPEDWRIPREGTRPS